MTITEYLLSKGVKLTKTRRGFKCVCPLPDHDDHDPSFHVFCPPGGEENWWCYGCLKGTSIWTLVRLVEQCSFREAVKIVGREPPKDFQAREHAVTKFYAVTISGKAQKAFSSGEVRAAFRSGQLTFEEADRAYCLLDREED